jgi:hypothetical protein
MFSSMFRIPHSLSGEPGCDDSFVDRHGDHAGRTGRGSGGRLENVTETDGHERRVAESPRQDRS